jgi:hypothetical protein
MLAAVLVLAPVAAAQTDSGYMQSDDTHYYDFWPGTWIEVIDGVPDTTASRFEVKRSVNPSAFEERWRLVYDGESHESVAIRSWDQTNNRWAFAWISDNALFQVWDGVKLEGEWYITKEFDIGGQKVHSRQAWIPEGENRLTRVLERSVDGGETWTTRYRGTFVKVAVE